MRVHRSILSAFTVLSLAVGAAGVGKATIEDCKLSINKLIDSTRRVAITGRGTKKDRASLIAHLETALTDLETVKPCTAVQKLNDFKSKVNELVTARRINTDDTAGTTAKKLIDDADIAIKCINTESAGCGT